MDEVVHRRRRHTLAEIGYDKLEPITVRVADDACDGANRRGPAMEQRVVDELAERLADQGALACVSGCVHEARQ